MYILLSKDKTKVVHLFKSFKLAKNMMEIDMEDMSTAILHHEIFIGLGQL